jgi:hypothetical protein
MHYRHTQIGYVMLAGMGLVIAILFFVFGVANVPQIAVVPVFVIVFLILSLFVSLTINVGDGRVLCSFGPGLIRKTIMLNEIVSARPVRNPVLLGWGIRWMPGQYWVWNVSGLDAVELTLRSGRRFRIGTDEPEELAKAIAMNMSLPVV